MSQAATLWRKILKPELFTNGLKILNYANLSAMEKAHLEEFFHKEILEDVVVLMKSTLLILPNGQKKFWQNSLR